MRCSSENGDTPVFFMRILILLRLLPPRGGRGLVNANAGRFGSLRPKLLPLNFSKEYAKLVLFKRSEGAKVNRTETITVISDKQEIRLSIRSIIYILMKGDFAYIHHSCEGTVRTKTPMVEIEKMLGTELDSFIKIKRGCLVSVFAIHNVTDKVNLGNGEELDYVARSAPKLNRELQEKRRKFIHDFADEVIPKTNEEFHAYYRVFDTLPIAFTDIEMVFDETNRAVDWVFRYANKALAELEKLPLSTLIGSQFGKLFPNMDVRWLKTYEWATLFGEVLQIIDYSPEIDTNLKIICFPTFQGHCGCILFDVDKLRFFRNTTDTDRAIAAFVGKLLN